MWQVVQARRRAIHLTETVVSARGRTASFGFPRPPLAPAKSRFALTISFQFLHGRRDPGHGTVRRDCWRSGNEPPEPSSDPGQNSKARVQGRPEIPLSFRLARGGRYPHSTTHGKRNKPNFGGPGLRKSEVGSQFYEGRIMRLLPRCRHAGTVPRRLAARQRPLVENLKEVGGRRKSGKRESGNGGGGPLAALRWLTRRN